MAVDRQQVLDLVATANIRVTLNQVEADAALAKVLRPDEHGRRPELVGVEEWDGKAPAWIRVATDDHLERHTKGTDYRFKRPPGGGNPVIWDGTRWGLLSIRTEVLVKGGFVGHLAGRKSHLDDSLATVAEFADELGGRDAVLIVFHLTAEVQKGKRYRLDLAHALRVLRHRRERRALKRLVRWYLRRGWVVYVVGDTNYDGMPLRPLRSCWHDKRSPGTLGGRTVDEVYAQQDSVDTRRVPNKSDHDGVVATYRRYL
jgi:hypothetical protein